MEISTLTRIVTPMGIAVIMLGMGMSLTLDDFERVWVQPKPVFIGIILQIIGLPLLGIAFVSIIGPDPVTAAAIMILSACPGGAITNLVSYISRGDAALSVSLTSINSFITVLTIPFITEFAVIHYLGKEAATNFNIAFVSLGIICITIPPIISGMLIKHKFPVGAQKCEPWVRKGTIVFILLLAGVACYSDSDILLNNYGKLSALACALAFSSFFLGGTVGFLARLPRRQVLTLSIEVGLHNSAMAIVIAISFLNMVALGIFSGFYLIVEYLLSGLIMYMMNTSLGSKFLGTDSLVCPKENHREVKRNMEI